jgi:hypothetical protein
MRQGSTGKIEATDAKQQLRRVQGTQADRLQVKKVYVL